MNQDVVGDLRRVRVRRADGSEQLVFLGEPREGAPSKVQAALRGGSLGARVEVGTTAEGGLERLERLEILEAHPYVTLVEGTLLVEVGGEERKIWQAPRRGCEYRGCDRTGCTVRIAWGTGSLPPEEEEFHDSHEVVVEVGMSDELPEALELALSELDANAGAAQGEWHRASSSSSSSLSNDNVNSNANAMISPTPSGWFRVMGPFCAPLPLPPMLGDDDDDEHPTHRDYLDECHRWVAAAERAWASARYHACAARVGRALALLTESSSSSSSLSPSLQGSLCAAHMLASKLASRGLRLREEEAGNAGNGCCRDESDAALRHARLALGAADHLSGAEEDKNARASALRRLAAQCIAMALWAEAEGALRALEEAGGGSPRSRRCMRTCRLRRLRDEEAERSMCVRMLKCTQD